MSKGKVALVDDEDFEWLSQWKWYFNGKYATRTLYHKNSKERKTIFMHVFITNPPSGMQVDHILGDKLDNQRHQLRICTKEENRHNQKVRKDNPSLFKGVAKRKDCNRWRSKIGLNGKTFHLGYFATKEEAALAYNEAAKKYFGNFARLNIV